MKIAIEIPNEFINEYKKDKFNESLARILNDLECEQRGMNFSLAGSYEIETLEMIRKSFENSMPMLDVIKTILEDEEKYK